MDKEDELKILQLRLEIKQLQKFLTVFEEQLTEEQINAFLDQISSTTNLLR